MDRSFILESSCWPNTQPIKISMIAKNKIIGFPDTCRAKRGRFCL